MATVSKICEALASSIPMPLGEVKKYARALIDSGDLPKAVGRSIPKLDMRDRAKLILAIAASERPSTCVERMRELFATKERSRATGLCAGEVLASELQELADGKVEAFQKWEYSDLEVSRTGAPYVRFRINQNLSNFQGYSSYQPEFVGYLLQGIEELSAFRQKYERSGLPVSAFVPGRVLMTLAFDSQTEADEALYQVAEKAWKQSGEQVPEQGDNE